MTKIPPLLATLALCACASTPGDYPSLALRDIERGGSLNPPQTEVTVATPAPEVINAAYELTEAVRSANAAFRAVEGEARARVAAAAGAAAGSEAWARAEVALAALSTERSQAMVALADLDRLYIAASSAGESVEEIAPLRAEAERLVLLQDGVLAELSRQLIS